MSKTIHQPFAISAAEWQEIFRLPAVQESWGLTDETLEEFTSCVYGVKFNYQSGSPGYVGDLYILQGDAITDNSPIVLGRKEERLVVLSNPSDNL
ncbi:MAG: hypothetical protein LC768_08825 [Acidobacteria bacterium]|nr:hypothetical protein [Acidobacteriota bacterium]MCA1638422.1 hypothetical protein [Acidobacteriota bacterium]